MSVNSRGVFLGCKYAAWQMITQNPYPSGDRGWIINIASVAGLVGLIGSVSYSASKGSVVEMTPLVALDFGAMAHPLQIHDDVLGLLRTSNDHLRFRWATQWPCSRSLREVLESEKGRLPCSYKSHLGFVAPRVWLQFQFHGTNVKAIPLSCYIGIHILTFLNLVTQWIDPTIFRISTAVFIGGVVYAFMVGCILKSSISEGDNSFAFGKYFREVGIWVITRLLPISFTWDFLREHSNGSKDLDKNRFLTTSLLLRWYPFSLFCSKIPKGEVARR